MAALDLGPGVRPHDSPAMGVVPQPEDGLPQRLRIADWNEQASHAILDDVDLPTGSGADHRLSHRHRFENHRDAVVAVRGEEWDNDETGARVEFPQGDRVLSSKGHLGSGQLAI